MQSEEVSLSVLRSSAKTVPQGVSGAGLGLASPTARIRSLRRTGGDQLGSISPGSVNRLDKVQANLTPSLVRDVRRMGWSILPIYL